MKFFLLFSTILFIHGLCTDDLAFSSVWRHGYNSSLRSPKSSSLLWRRLRCWLYLRQVLQDLDGTQAAEVETARQVNSDQPRWAESRLSLVGSQFYFMQGALWATSSRVGRLFLMIQASQAGFVSSVLKVGIGSCS